MFSPPILALIVHAASGPNLCQESRLATGQAMTPEQNVTQDEYITRATAMLFTHL